MELVSLVMIVEHQRDRQQVQKEVHQVLHDAALKDVILQVLVHQHEIGLHQQHC